MNRVRHVSWFLLALSLLFNVFFAAGYARARSEGDPGGAVASPANDVGHALGLDSRQRAAYSAMREQFDADAADLGSSVALLQRQFMDELQRAEPDLDRLRELATRNAELERERRLIAGSRMRDFVAMLTPEQRRALAGHLGRASEQERRHRWLLERFDADGDGKLNDDEKAEATTFCERRRTEWRQREADMIARFDGNGDGDLDDPGEREAMKAYWAERRRSGPPGGPRGHRRHGPGDPGEPGGFRGPDSDRGGPGRPGSDPGSGG